MTSADIILVNFYAPWCPWSARLAPIWEASAALIHSKYPIQTVKVARVDCTDPAVQPKCRNHHINAFPTVRVYRRGNDLQDVGGGRRVNPTLKNGLIYAPHPPAQARAPGVLRRQNA